MALDESAMTDLLAALRAGGGLDIVREALGLVLQALIDAERAAWFLADASPESCLDVLRVVLRERRDDA